MSTAATRCRLLLIEGALEKALAVTDHSWPGVRARGQRAEFLASRALALMLLGESSRAHALLTEAEELSTELEPSTLCEWVRVLFTLGHDEQKGMQLATETFSKTLDSGLTDMFVFAYRADPRILAAVASGSRTDLDLMPILLRANDRSRARAAGFHLPSVTRSPRGGLTP
jgi:hypothetical protein